MSSRKNGETRKTSEAGIQSVPMKAGTDKPYRDINPESPVASLDRTNASDMVGRYSARHHLGVGESPPATSDPSLVRPA
jgi:hypothetical protein